jgi:cellulose synthase/poly-beta-1,6-N-acetylglucosamine synthase-like glycosyltransferase
MDIVSLVIALTCAMLSLLIAFVFVIPMLHYEGNGTKSFSRGLSIWLTDTLGSALVRLEEHFWFYVPLGIIGLWRWLTWGFKRICSAYYKPIEVQPHPFESSMSIITPVYNEDPKTFRKALDSWEANRPDEIIAVIDASDQECIKTFREFSHGKDWAKLLITAKRGKREAIVEGIIAANSKIVALVDSDTMWSNEIRKDLLAPFNDPDIAGVTPRNHPIERNSLWQKMTDIFWDIRNFYDLPSQTAMGCALTCLTGRTSLYRREILLPKLDEFLNEVLLGRRKESGEDKCFTRLVQKEGWKTYYQKTATIYSAAAPDFRTFVSQRLRWTRNSHNSDLASLVEGWAWKHPYLAFYMVDRYLSTFTLFLGPIFMGISIFLNQWIVAGAILALWMSGRAIKILPHIKRHPRDLILLPVFVVVYFLVALIKLYALVTIREQIWIREDHLADQRIEYRKPGLFQKIKDWILTTEIITSIVFVVILVLR